MKNIKGITLISLVITIIVLIILSSVGIYLSLGENGIISRAKNAKQEYLNSQAKEEDDINDLYSQMLIATNEGSQITITLEDLNKLIDKRVEEITGPKNMSSPILLTTLDLPNTSSSSRAAGTYKASSTSYTKTNTDVMSNYLSFEEGKGWTVLKDGWYYINSFSSHTTSLTNGSAVILYFYINNQEFRLTYNATVSGQSYSAREAANNTVYLKAGDVIDCGFALSAAGTYSHATINMYAFFE